jgi:hypothetical protein
VRRAREMAGHLMKIELEVDGLSQLDEALALSIRASGRTWSCWTISASPI